MRRDLTLSVSPAKAGVQMACAAPDVAPDRESLRPPPWSGSRPSPGYGCCLRQKI